MNRCSSRNPQAGFSLIEVLTVVGIIGVLAALSAPPIYSYLRQYRIRGAIQELTGNINNARNRAIMKSSNHGVVFVVEDANTYWLHMEDDQQSSSGPLSGARQAPNFTTPDPAQSIRYRLPGSVVFATAAECGAVPAPTPAFTPNAYGIRFSRLGAACQPSNSDPRCPEVSPSPSTTLPSLIQNDAATGNTTLCLQDKRGESSGTCPTCPSRWIRVTAGGRIVGQP